MIDGSRSPSRLCARAGRGRSLASAGATIGLARRNSARRSIGDPSIARFSRDSSCSSGSTGRRADVIEHLVGLQAQEPIDPVRRPLVADRGLRPDDPVRPARGSTRCPSPAPARDHPSRHRSRPARHAARSSVRSSSGCWRRAARSAGASSAPGVDQDAVVEAGRRLLEEQPRTRAELREALGAPVPDAPTPPPSPRR